MGLEAEAARSERLFERPQRLRTPNLGYAASPMHYLFARENSELLAQIAWARSLLSFDFDGTLAPTIADRNAATIRPATVKLLHRVAQLFPCAVVSGRSHADLSQRLGRVRFERIISNLGFEAGRHDPAVARAMRNARELLRSELGAVQGVELEDKGYTLAIHYRRSRRKNAARAAIAKAAERLPSALHLLRGKLVVNVIHSKAPTKATAVLRLRDELRADTVLYVGDGASDEAVFELDQPGRLSSVRVGRSRTSRASYYVRDQLEIDRLLAVLIELRTRSRTASAR